MIDLDKLFSDYVSDYVNENIGKKKPDEIEEEIHDLYHKWVDEYSPALDCSPVEFVGKLKKEGKLVDYVEELLENSVEISDIVGDACGADEEKGLIQLWYKYEDYRAVILAMLKNSDSGAESTEDLFVETALFSTDEGLSELACEALYEGHERAVDKILDRFDELDDDRKLLACDVLYRYPGHDKTFELLLKYFALGENIPLFAEYIGAYGDERAIDRLIEFAKRNSMSKFEFREIRNAVERLGGDMPQYNYDIVE